MKICKNKYIRCVAHQKKFIFEFFTLKWIFPPTRAQYSFNSSSQLNLDYHNVHWRKNIKLNDLWKIFKYLNNFEGDDRYCHFSFLPPRGTFFFDCSFQNIEHIFQPNISNVFQRLRNICCALAIKYQSLVRVWFESLEFFFCNSAIKDKLFFVW